MNDAAGRNLPIGPLRAFEAVARHLNFRAAGEQLHLTQPAISRQIKTLEDQLGTRLFVRGTRHVELSGAGASLLAAVAPLIERLDATVHQIRSAQARPHVGLTTFASFASLWLLPRLPGFQATAPQIDIRISASDAPADFDDPAFDLALRHCRPADAPSGSVRLFDELLTPVISPALLARAPLGSPAELSSHTLLEEEGSGSGTRYTRWAHWLEAHGRGRRVAPRGWITLNYTHQLIQAALAGQGVALTRWALVADLIERGDLVEPFGPRGRLSSPFAYWLVRWPARRERAELQTFEDWLLAQASITRAQIDRARDSAQTLR